MLWLVVEDGVCCEDGFDFVLFDYEIEFVLFGMFGEFFCVVV